jgi:ABC-type bacteriocin/lantibiotic exporter with double-glycine peptidase domain
VKALILLALLFPLEAGAYEIESVPFVKQEDRLCGPASLCSVMSYYGHDIDQREIGDAVYSGDLRGSLITDMEKYAGEKGFRTRLAQGSIDDLEGFIRDGRPVIVLVDLGFWVISRPHYLVVTGVTKSTVTAHTGHEDSRTFSRKEFGNIWQKKGSVYLLVHP